jgi:methylenetetrahydrofolate--tRNA-(uracil-5-)-methyltransferase
LRRLDSLLIQAASRARVPAGHALTVDRDLFSQEIERALEAEPSITIARDEVTTLDPSQIWIVASGPLTSTLWPPKSRASPGAIACFSTTASVRLSTPESIDTSIAFRASRYGKSLDGTDDYLNCPFDKPQYEAFLDALLAADSVPAHIEQDQVKYFEACLPMKELGPPRPRNSALRTDEAHGADRSAHRPPSLRGRAASQEDIRSAASIWSDFKITCASASRRAYCA